MTQDSEVIKDDSDSTDSSSENQSSSQPAQPEQHVARVPSTPGTLTRLISRYSSAKESGAYQGAFSYAGEWHSFALGLGVGLYGSPAMKTAIVAYAIGRGGRGSLSADSHVKDVADEPAYAIAGVALGSQASGAQSVLTTLQGVLPA